LPDDEGKGQESRARISTGYKKLDVNFSTPELGLGLGVSIKTVNFPDKDTVWYGHNYSRIDNELRAESMDYHYRQPFTVLVGVLFLPMLACSQDENKASKRSSFAAAVEYFRKRSNRKDVKGDLDRFEGFFVALYERDGADRGDVLFFDVNSTPPRFGRPADGALSFDEFVEAVRILFLERNPPKRPIYKE